MAKANLQRLGKISFAKATGVESQLPISLAVVDFDCCSKQSKLVDETDSMRHLRPAIILRSTLLLACLAL
ncbi:MAG: hypothetical protein ACOVN2_02565, partial [Usitatibacteraceae bacterium]